MPRNDDSSTPSRHGESERGERGRDHHQYHHPSLAETARQPEYSNQTSAALSAAGSRYSRQPSVTPSKAASQSVYSTQSAQLFTTNSATPRSRRSSQVARDSPAAREEGYRHRNNELFVAPINASYKGGSVTSKEIERVDRHRGVMDDREMRGNTISQSAIISWDTDGDRYSRTRGSSRLLEKKTPYKESRKVIMHAWSERIPTGVMMQDRRGETTISLEQSRHSTRIHISSGENSNPVRSTRIIPQYEECDSGASRTTAHSRAIENSGSIASRISRRDPPVAIIDYSTAGIQRIRAPATDGSIVGKSPARSRSFVIPQPRDSQVDNKNSVASASTTGTEAP